MKKKCVRRTVLLGAACALLLAAASGYSMAFNGGRLVEPMDFSTYVFRASSPWRSRSATWGIWLSSWWGILCPADIGRRPPAPPGR